MCGYVLNARDRLKSNVTGWRMLSQTSDIKFIYFEGGLEEV
jgi:hypothetical protein